MKNLFDDNEPIVFSAILSLGEVGTKNEIMLFQYKLVTNKTKGSDAFALLAAIKQSTEKILQRSKSKK